MLSIIHINTYVHTLIIKDILTPIDRLTTKMHNCNCIDVKTKGLTSPYKISNPILFTHSLTHPYDFILPFHQKWRLKRRWSIFSEFQSFMFNTYSLFTPSFIHSFGHSGIQAFIYSFSCLWYKTDLLMIILLSMCVCLRVDVNNAEIHRIPRQ